MLTSRNCRKWKLSFLEVARIVLRDFFCFFFLALACVEPKLFFAFVRENSPVQPLPWVAQVEIEYNTCMPSIWAIVRQVVSLGYWVFVTPYQGKYWTDRNTPGSTHQHVGSYII